MAATGQAATEGLNLQARFEQLESAINEAHTVVDQMMPREQPIDKGPEIAASTAIQTGNRCQQSLANLINRLQSLRDQVGQV